MTKNHEVLNIGHCYEIDSQTIVYIYIYIYIYIYKDFNFNLMTISFDSVRVQNFFFHDDIVKYEALFIKPDEFLKN